MADQLNGTPYSLPDDVGGDALNAVREREAKISERLAAAQAKVVEEVRAHADVSGVQRSREIYESNRIEGLGPDLQRTSQLIGEYAHLDVHATMFKDMLERSVKSDPQLVAVLGLNAAKVLSEELMASYLDRQITAADLRALHAQICVGESHAGAFKLWVNEIEGSEHKPPLPIDTGSHVADLTDWLASPGQLPPSVIAGVAHGWLTHIHPFTDGNGRLARLLMNLLLTAAGMPPVIVRHDTDRIRYIEALANSDVGGDIFPLIDIVLDAQHRFAKEIGRPAALRRIIRAEFDKQAQNYYESWLRLVERFLGELSASLSANRLQFEILHLPSKRAFEQLLEADSSGNSWLARIHGGRNTLLLWFGYSSQEIGGKVQSSVRWPSIYVSVRAPSYSPRPYRLAHPPESGGVHELLLRPTSKNQVYVRTFSHVRVGGLRDGADEVAAMLARGAAHAS